MKHTSYTAVMLASLLASTISSPILANAPQNQGIDSEVLCATRLYEQGHLQEAIDSAENSTKQHPEAWLPHATLAYLTWQQGNVADALQHGKDAAQLAPRNKFCLLNLGHMEQNLADFDGAIAEYRKAVDAAPEDWSTHIALINCLIRTGKEDEALRALNKMSEQAQPDFEWYFQLGQGYVELSQTSPAFETFSKANKLARTSAQKKRCSIALLNAQLTGHYLQSARRTLKELAKVSASYDGDLLVRIEDELISSSQPQKAAALFQEALAPETNADDYFKLGTVFRDKAATCQSGSAKERNWLALSSAALEKAITIEGRDTRFYFALAGVKDAQNETQKMLGSLKTVSALDVTDRLAPYLVSHPEAKLELVKFDINGLTCGCQMTRVDVALQKTTGVVFSSVTKIQPYRGTILLDEGITSAADVAKEVANTAFKNYPKTKVTPPTVRFEHLTSTDICGTSAIVRAAELARSVELPPLTRRLPVEMPMMPPEATSLSAKSSDIN